MESKGPHVYLKTEHWAELSPNLKKRLKRGRQDVSNICKLIVRSAKVSTLPPVEIVDQIWMGEDVQRDGRSSILTIDGKDFIGVQLPAPTAICRDFRLVRAILVHEFSHCFDLIVRALEHKDSGLTDSLDLSVAGKLSSAEEEEWDKEMLVDPGDWFGDEDVSNFIHWNDDRFQSLLEATSIVAKELDAKSLSRDVETERLSIPGEIIDHIRLIQKRRR